MGNEFSWLIEPKNTSYYSVLSNRLEHDNTTRLSMLGSLLLAAFLLVLIPAQLFDSRELGGALIWTKPIKFSLSLALHFFTLALLAQLIVRRHRVNKTLTGFMYAGVAAALFELIYISIQAGRGRKSHFNLDTGTEALMYSIMGVGALLLVAVSFVLGVMVWRFSYYRVKKIELTAAGNDLKIEDNQLGLRWGAILGLSLGSCLTLIFAGYMSTSGSHLVGQAVAGSTTMPITGWSLSLGDLRISHFIATHLIQILPLIGLISDKLKLSSKIVIIVSTIILVGFSIVSFLVALAGNSLFG